MNNFSSASQSKSVIGEGYRLTDVQWMTLLRSLDANFVFLFGRKSAGKSAILSSLLHVGCVSQYKLGLTFHPDFAHLTDCAKTFTDPAMSAVVGRLMTESESTWNTLRGCFKWRSEMGCSQGFLPKRTEAGRPPLMLFGRAEPWSTEVDDRRIVFLEVAGETMQGIAGDGGVLPRNVDVYFRSKGLRLVFLLVVPWDEAQNDDALVARFIEHVQGLNKSHRHAKFVLLLTKWDSYPSGKGANAKQFVAEAMTATWALMQFRHNHVSEFTIGSVEMAETDVMKADGKDLAEAPFLQRLKPSHTCELWKTIFNSFSDIPLQQRSLLSRIREWTKS